MQIRHKIVVLLLVIGCAIILTSCLVVSCIILSRKHSLLQTRKNNFVLNEETKNNANGGRKSSSVRKEEYTTTTTRTEKNNVGTVRKSYPPHPERDINLRRDHSPPDSNSDRTRGDAHLGKALRLLPFQMAVGPKEGNAMPPPLREAEFGGERGVHFVKNPSERFSHQDNRNGDRRRNNGIGEDGGGGLIDFLKLIMGKIRYFAGMIWELAVGAKKKAVGNNGSGGGGNGNGNSGNNDSDRLWAEREALYHLEKAADLGNQHAQNMIASSLASGILPVRDHPSLRRPHSNSTSSASSSSSTPPSLKVTADFYEGGEQLARAHVLWHMAAMDGNTEAAMALGYRHRYSALVDPKSFSDFYHTALVSDEDLLSSLSSSDNGSGTTKNQNEQKEDESLLSTPKYVHGNNPNQHYGALGTCESAMLYYEAAAHSVIDALESSPLRGKADPAKDYHILSEIHSRGASSALDGHNKPDEIEEALQYYRMRAGGTGGSPDVNAAFTLATMYHYGIKGVKQDMKLAYKYYEIGADNGSWEAAGQAGKFHVWGMGMEDHERDLIKAYGYFRMATPGAFEGCEMRFKKHVEEHNKKQNLKKKTKEVDEKEKRNRKRKKKDKSNGKDDEDDVDDPNSKGDDDNDVDDTIDDEDEEDEDITMLSFDNDDEMCDHPALNGMGLLYLFGIPMVVPIDFDKAKKYFNLAKALGNPEASYNLGMLRLGWLKPQIGDRNVGETSDEDENLIKKFEGIMSEVDTATNSVMEQLTNIMSGSQAERVLDGLKSALSESVFTDEDNSKVMDNMLKRAKNGVSKADYVLAANELRHASNMGHIQAKHRLAMLYARGVSQPHKLDPSKVVEVMPKSCPKALALYKQVADNGITTSRRIRAAYKQYVNGDFESSLRNYLAAAETGSLVGQVNAAFLLERGHCLGMAHSDCMRASVRFWRAAARQGAEESFASGGTSHKSARQKATEAASLKVGDFYYYGRLVDRDGDRHAIGNKHDNVESDGFKVRDGFSARSDEFAVTPFPWFRFILYPEDLLPVIRRLSIGFVRWLFPSVREHSDDVNDTEGYFDSSCPDSSVSKDGTCLPSEKSRSNDESDKVVDHLLIAAQYYKQAAEDHVSQRAHFNLGFMHEWGLGLAQDFPLAKRHYDLASSSMQGEAEVAVQIALFGMSVHEKVIKFRAFLLQWWNQEPEIRSISQLLSPYLLTNINGQ